ncbi:cation-transporting P-type ATPase [Streptomyces sp. NPDC093984]
MSSPRGLSSGEVAARQARYGANELPISRADGPPCASQP